MDRQVQKINAAPNYHKIYSDIIQLKYPEKEKYCQSILSKKELSALEVIMINDIIFSKYKKENLVFNQMHRAYNKQTILEILNYQKNNKLNNSQLALHFKLSRNTVAKWKKLYKTT